MVLCGNIKTLGVNKYGWILCGVMNFYESNIKIAYVLFSGNNTEDASNIARSKF